jgi:hypothetical protein
VSKFPTTIGGAHRRVTGKKGGICDQARPEEHRRHAGACCYQKSAPFLWALRFISENAGAQIFCLTAGKYPCRWLSENKVGRRLRASFSRADSDPRCLPARLGLARWGEIARLLPAGLIAPAGRRAWTTPGPTPSEAFNDLQRLVRHERGL